MILAKIAAVAAASALVLIPAGSASADSGFLTDPTGDTPDITRLAYNNGKSSVSMTMRLGDLALAQNVGFYVKWGTGKYYQAFSSPSAGLKELRYSSGAGAVPKKVRCGNLTITRSAAKDTVRVVIPRACLPKAPDKVRFQGIATMGLFSSDQTRTSARIARG